MLSVVLSERNLRTLLSKLERKRAGDTTERTIIKQGVWSTIDANVDTQETPVRVFVSAAEDSEVYVGREPGKISPADEARIYPYK